MRAEMGLSSFAFYCCDKDQDQSTLGDNGHLSPLKKGKAEPGGRNGSRGREGMLPTACSVSFLTHPRITRLRVVNSGLSPSTSIIN